MGSEAGVLRIIDVSDNNGAVDFGEVARAGIAAVWVKATEGRTFAAETYEHNLRSARAAGLAVGAYHFARPDHNAPEDEARHFLSFLSLNAGDLRPALDFETASNLSAAEQVQWARDYNHVVFEEVRRWPVFYSFKSFIEGLGATTPIGGGLWLADYGRNDGAEHAVAPPRPWRRILAHQYTSNGSIPGVHGRCDVSSAEQLAALQV